MVEIYFLKERCTFFYNYKNSQEILLVYNNIYCTVFEISTVLNFNCCEIKGKKIEGRNQNIDKESNQLMKTNIELDFVRNQVILNLICKNNS